MLIVHKGEDKARNAWKGLIHGGVKMMEVGRVCIKTAGREAGKVCVVVKAPDGGFVTVTGPKSLTSVKRRRCNIEHLEPLEHKLDIKSDASDTEVEQALKGEGVLEKVQAVLYPQSARPAKTWAARPEKAGAGARPAKAANGSRKEKAKK